MARPADALNSGRARNQSRASGRAIAPEVKTRGRWHETRICGLAAHGQADLPPGPPPPGPIASAGPAAAPLGFRPAIRRLHILAVDDSPANLSVLRALLSTTGFQLQTAPDAATGLDLLAAGARDGRPFDVVLMDVMMPGMDGLEATRRIRARPGTEAGIPVIAVTASAFLEDVLACEAAGMNGHVPKPVERMTLLRAIARVVDPAGEERAAEGDGLAALRPLFLAELGARLAALRRFQPDCREGEAASGAAEGMPHSLTDPGTSDHTPAAGTDHAVETVHGIAGTIGHLGEADLVEAARATLRGLRSGAPDAPSQVMALAAAIAARFPGLDAAPQVEAA